MHSGVGAPDSTCWNSRTLCGDGVPGADLAAGLTPRRLSRAGRPLRWAAHSAGCSSYCRELWQSRRLTAPRNWRPRINQLIPDTRTTYGSQSHFSANADGKLAGRGSVLCRMFLTWIVWRRDRHVDLGLPLCLDLWDWRERRSGLGVALA